MIPHQDLEQLIQYYKGELTENALLNKAATLAAKKHVLLSDPQLPPARSRVNGMPQRGLIKYSYHGRHVIFPNVGTRSGTGFGRCSVGHVTLMDPRYIDPAVSRENRRENKSGNILKACLVCLVRNHGFPFTGQ